MADTLVDLTVEIVLAILAGTVVAAALSYGHLEPEVMERFRKEFMERHWPKLLRGSVETLTLFAGILLGLVLIGLIMDCRSSSPAEEPEYDEASADADKEPTNKLKRRKTSRNPYNERSRVDPDEAAFKQTQKALEAAKAQVAWYAAAYDAQIKQLKQRDTEARDGKRLIQNQALEVARCEHRADAADRTLHIKNEYIQVMARTLNFKDCKIADQDAAITLQAQQIKDSAFDLEAMSKKIEEKDQRLWEAAGRNTLADHEIAKLKAAVADEYDELEYCCALDTIDRRDQTINALEKQIAQDAKDNDFNQESAETLSKLLVTLGDKTATQAIRELEAWAVDRAARLEDFVTLSGPVENAQKDECERLCNTIDLQHKLLRKSIETRESQRKTLTEVNTKLAALTVKENANIKTHDQFVGEKQHLLDALNNSQQSLQAVRAELATGRKQRSHQLLQHALVEKKLKVVSKAHDEKATKLAAVAEQLAATEKAYETAIGGRSHESAAMKGRFCMITEALKQITGVEVDLSNVKSTEELVAMLEQASSEQEAKLAETCAELSAENEELKENLSAEKSAVAALSATNEEMKHELLCEQYQMSEPSPAKAELMKELDAQRAVMKDLNDKIELNNKRADKAFIELQDTLGKTARELAMVKREGPSRKLEHKINSLETLLKLSNEDNKTLFHKKLDAESKVETLTATVTHQEGRLKTARECLDRCVNINNKMRKDLDRQINQIEDLSTRLEKINNASHAREEEVQRLKVVLQGREQRVLALEETREKLEKQLVLGEEFVEVSADDAPAAVSVTTERDEITIVQAEDEDEDEDKDADVDDGDDDFEAVEYCPDCADDSETVEEEDGVDGFEAVDVDEDGEGLETEIGAPEVRVQ
jgi:hypothetical protein